MRRIAVFAMGLALCLTACAHTVGKRLTDEERLDRLYNVFGVTSKTLLDTSFLGPIPRRVVVMPLRRYRVEDQRMAEALGKHIGNAGFEVVERAVFRRAAREYGVPLMDAVELEHLQEIGKIAHMDGAFLCSVEGAFLPAAKVKLVDVKTGEMVSTTEVKYTLYTIQKGAVLSSETVAEAVMLSLKIELRVEEEDPFLQGQ